MPTFITPTDPIVGAMNNSGDEYASQEWRLANRLASHRAPMDRGRNVYLLVDGTYVEKEPSIPSTISKVYHGGHKNIITTAEQTSLTAAGYGAYISA